MCQQAPDDAQLVKAAVAGSREAFDALASRYQARLFNTLLRITGSAEDAADGVQDALVQAYVKLGSFRGQSQFYTWLYRIAMNLTASRRRRRRPTASVEELRESAGEEPVDDAAGPETTALSRERIALVRSALGHLGDQPRKVLILRELEGFSYEEIGEILDLPAGTVRSRLFRARLQLREQLKSMDEEAERKVTSD